MGHVLEAARLIAHLAFDDQRPAIADRFQAA